MSVLGVGQVDLLELDIDIRLRDVWRILTDQDELTTESVASLIRASYATGHMDALREAKPWDFYEANGYAVPKRGWYA